MTLKKLARSFSLCAALVAFSFAACSAEGERPRADATNAPNSSNAATATNAPQASNDRGATLRAEPQVVTAAAEEARLAAGGQAEAVVRVRIAEGYHVNANPPSDRFYVGTEVRVEPQGGLTPGKPTYPPGESKKFQFSDQPLLVYEGEAVIKLPLSAAASAAKGRHTLTAKVRVQPCNDEACLPPREIGANIPVVIE
jgi:DsbC/DsbD-like thiol-disulfide interchange protein